MRSSDALPPSAVSPWPIARTMLPSAIGSPPRASRAHFLVEAVESRSSATSFCIVDEFHAGLTTIESTLRVSPWPGLLSSLAPMTSRRLAAVVPPSTQCAAVSTQREEMSVPPQKWKPLVVCTETNHG